MKNLIEIIGAKEHNLKNVSINIPKNKFVVITGPSGSGKSSLAFDTLYAEGQRRYLDSITNSRFFAPIPKPNVEKITGLIPSIAIDQKTTARNPRSTVGTMTDIYDFLRLMYARIGAVYSPKTGLKINKFTKEEIVSILLSLPSDTKLRLCSPILINKDKNFCQKKIMELKNTGHEKIKVDGSITKLDPIPVLEDDKQYNIEVIVDRVIINEDTDGKRLEKSIDECLEISGGSVFVDVVDIAESREVLTVKFEKKSTVVLSTKYVCIESDFKLDKLEPKIFSFNTPHGACKNCNGLGVEYTFKEDLIVPNKALSLLDGAVESWQTSNTRYINQVIIALSKQYNFDANAPFEELSDDVKNIIFYGTEKEIEILTDDEFAQKKVKIKFKGAINELKEKLANSQDDPILLEECERFQDYTDCHVCHGQRLRSESLQVKIDGRSISEITNLSIKNAKAWFEGLPQKLNEKEMPVAKPILEEIVGRLDLLIEIGLQYLTLDRSANTLSGGEAQRIRLSNQMGSSLSGVLYVLDEPSIGLHQSDNKKLIQSIKKLRDIGNSVIVIEHDEETMLEADYIVDVGPGAGVYGGEIVSEGTVEETKKCETGVTGLFLSGKEQIETPKVFRKYGKGKFLEITGARGNNLKNVDLKIPLGKFVSVAGVSGGGKSTLIIDTLYPAVARAISRVKAKAEPFNELLGIENIDKIIKIDQSPIGRTPRSNPATYIGLFGLIRDLFTALPEARYRGYTSGRFSFNVKGGRCENCSGDGMVKIEMQFLPDVYVECDVCKGRRYNKETLEVKYNGHSIADVLNMTVYEALEIFKSETNIMDKLKCLYNVGLDYIKLGQSATTLSGGEAQRIKLSKELSRISTGSTMYILDEPTTGLHSHDIKRLLKILQQLVDYGNTVIVIEHNLDVIKTSDYVFDIGPEGGENGGIIVAEGTPLELSKTNSPTGVFLKKYFD